MSREIAERNLKIGLFGAALTLVGDLLIGAAKFPDGANMIEGYFAIALAMPAWRPILGGLIGFAGICLEFPGLMTIYPLIRARCPVAAGSISFRCTFILPSAAERCICPAACSCGSIRLQPRRQDRRSDMTSR